MKALALTLWDKKIFKVFSFGCHGKPKFLMEFKSLKFSESASPKDHFCEVSLKSLAGFREEDFLSNCSWTDGQTDILKNGT